MPGVGISYLGSGYVGSVSGSAEGRSLGVFNFSVVALSTGFDLKISLDIPGISEAPDWSRELQVLRKIGEWPQSVTDSGATIIVSKTYALVGSITDTFIDSDLQPGQIYYYALFEKRNDGVWINDKILGLDSAYPYDRWGASTYLFNSMPRGWQKIDVENDNDLQNFLSIFGAFVDNLKTDAENLLSLFEINTIHEDLLPYLDAKIAWPTWYATGGIQKRKELLRAVDAYKLVGREQCYETLLEEVSNWEVEIDEGWRYVMFTNGLHNSTTPDTTNPNLLPNIGFLSDIAKYTNDSNSWHSVSGLVFKLTEIPGVSDEFTQVMIDRYHELIELVRATFVNYNLYLTPISEEVFPMTWVLDDWDHGDDVYTYTESMAVTLEEDLGATTSSLFLFISNALTSTSTTATDRTFHSALTYV